MEVRLLRTFVAVAELRHFAKAADACNLSQPAVSHQIALLEEEVGTRLFNRTGRRVTMTVAGEVLLDEARRILGAVDRARERVQQVSSGAVGRIRLGASPTPGLYLLPALLPAYRQRYPRYDLHFEIRPVRQLCELVAGNQLDMAVVAGPTPPSELRSRAIGRDELVAVAAAGAPLARPAPVRPRQMEGESWVLREEGSETRRLVLSWLQRHRIAPAHTITLDGPDAVKRAVMAGMGVALVSKLTVQEEIETGRLAQVNMAAALPWCDVCVLDHPQKHHGAACRAMLALLDESWGARAGGGEAEAPQARSARAVGVVRPTRKRGMPRGQGSAPRSPA
jgi:LysR family transcriptional regulator, transcriptional activator of the cysJI operon